MHSKNVLCSYSVHAIVFGADESLLDIKLNNGFKFTRISLVPSSGHLNDIFDSSDVDLRREYEQARINEHTLDVICAVKEKEYSQSLDRIEEQFETDVAEDLISIDNQIRCIRLFTEGPVRCKKVAFCQKFDSPLERIMNPCKHHCVIPIGEAMATKPISMFHCNNNEAESISRSLSRIILPISDEVLNVCHIYYDLSYHTDPCVSITLLTTALEIMFLEKDANAKKEKLARRCALFLSNDDKCIASIYRRLKVLYKKRSEFVHEGKTQSIANDDIVSLRDFVRQSILLALSFPESKQQRIDRIAEAVTKRSDLFNNIPI